MKSLKYITNCYVYLQDCSNKPVHAHHTDNLVWEKLIYIIKGTALFSSEYGTANVRVGDILYVPPGLEYHTVWNSSRGFCTIGFCGNEPFIKNDSPQFEVLSSEHFCMFRNNFYELNNIWMNDGGSYLFMSKLMSLLNELSLIRNQLISPSALQESIAWLAQNCNKEIDVKQLAAIANMSVSHYYRSFRNATGYSVTDYKNSLLMRRAETLLSIGEGSISQIAEKLGFNDVFYFSRLFKKYIGVSPREYRQKYHGIN